ncbi:MAG: SCP2 sterol-binding domain-containing protein [Bacillota bacterium]|nr:SCP2 sterol-binding domain-containing protein [Bacillota bacterium]
MAYKNAEEIYDVFRIMMDKVQNNQELKKKLSGANIAVALSVPNLDAFITLNLYGKIEAIYGPTDIKIDCTSIQNDDIFNKFWQGKINLMMATFQGKIKTQGAVTDMLKLVPNLKPVYKLYTEALKEAGHEDLVA